MTMPTIWKTIGREILMQDERGDEEDGDDDRADKSWLRTAAQEPKGCAVKRSHA